MAQESEDPNDIEWSVPNGNNHQRLTDEKCSDVQDPMPEVALPPVDRGKEAWLFLTACWTVQFLIYGV